MKIISRNTQVISVSLPKNVAQKLERARQIRGQSRSAFITFLVNQLAEEERWQRVYKKGGQTARRLKITSEDDIDRLLHEA